MAKKKTTVAASDLSQKRESPVTLNMTYEEAMKKALNTPLPKKASKKKKAV